MPRRFASGAAPLDHRLCHVSHFPASRSVSVASGPNTGHATRGGGLNPRNFTGERRLPRPATNVSAWPNFFCEGSAAADPKPVGAKSGNRDAVTARVGRNVIEGRSAARGYANRVTSKSRGGAADAWNTQPPRAIYAHPDCLCVPTTSLFFSFGSAADFEPVFTRSVRFARTWFASRRPT